MGGGGGGGGGLHNCLRATLEGECPSRRQGTREKAIGFPVDSSGRSKDFAGKVPFNVLAIGSNDRITPSRSSRSIRGDGDRPAGIQLNTGNYVCRRKEKK